MGSLLEVILIGLCLVELPHSHPLIDIMDEERIPQVTWLWLLINLLLYQLAVPKVLLHHASSLRVQFLAA